MSKTWKAVVVVLLVIAVAAVLASKRNGASEATPPPAATSRAAAPTSSPAAQPKALPQLVELGSKTCQACQAMAPIIEELRQEQAGRIEVVFYDVYERKEKAKEYHVRLIPTQVFIGADGKEFFRHQGFLAKEDILAAFKEHGVDTDGAED